MRSTTSRWTALLAAVVALLPTAARDALAQGCAMCGSITADDPTARAFSWSVLFLMAAPYTIAGAFGSWIFFTYRRARTHPRGPVIDLARVRRALPVAELKGDAP